jgi:hypothetical protein
MGLNVRIAARTALCAALLRPHGNVSGFVALPYSRQPVNDAVLGLEILLGLAGLDKPFDASRSQPHGLSPRRSSA